MREIKRVSGGLFEAEEEFEVFTCRFEVLDEETNLQH